MTWTEHKDAGKEAFTKGKYKEALSFYFRALEELNLEGQGSHDSGTNNVDYSGINSVRGNCNGRNNNCHSSHTNKRQILLSNVVACRLKVGGKDMVTKAVEEAKEVCV